MISSAAIYGAGGHARVIASILHSCKTSIYGIFDDSYRGPEVIQGAQVIGKFHDILEHKNSIDSVYLALGDSKLRKEAFTFLSENNFNLPPLIHSKAVVENDLKIAQGSVVCIGAIIGTEVEIGEGVIINTGCSVDHESVVGDFVQLNPKVVVAGRVKIGANTFVGINACIADRLTIGKNVIIGAGSIVLRDVPDGEKVLGVYH